MRRSRGCARCRGRDTQVDKDTCTLRRGPGQARRGPVVVPRGAWRPSVSWWSVEVRKKDNRLPSTGNLIGSPRCFSLAHTRGAVVNCMPGNMTQLCDRTACIAALRRAPRCNGTVEAGLKSAQPMCGRPGLPILWAPSRVPVAGTQWLVSGGRTGCLGAKHVCDTRCVDAYSRTTTRQRPAWWQL